MFKKTNISVKDYKISNRKSALWINVSRSSNGSHSNRHRPKCSSKNSSCQSSGWLKVCKNWSCLNRYNRWLSCGSKGSYCNSSWCETNCWQSCCASNTCCSSTSNQTGCCRVSNYILEAIEISLIWWLLMFSILRSICRYLLLRLDWDLSSFFLMEPMDLEVVDRLWIVKILAVCCQDEDDDEKCHEKLRHFEVGEKWL